MTKPVLLATTALILVSAPASAQTAAGAPSATEQAGSVDRAAGAAAAADAAADDYGREIIVTATRRSEALSDVPLSVSAVTADTLRNSGATDIRQLNQVSPSLLVSSTSSEAGAGGARIRGVGTVGDNPGLESSVATFIDGVYRNRAGVGLTELGAIERIEVLRGPQGTLFGRNASAGLISVITAKPKFAFGANAEASYGNYDYHRLAGGVTGPLSRTVAARVDGAYTKRDGFLDDVVSGRSVNNRDRYIVRGQLLYEPGEDLSVRLIGDYSDRNEECCGGTYLPARNVVRNADGTLSTPANSVIGIERALGAIINTDTFSREGSITPGQGYRGDVRDYGVSAEITYDLGGANFTSITSYRDWRWLRGQDADYNNLDILHRAGDGTANQRFKTFTQELRLQGSAFGDRLDWLVGGYFAREKLHFADNLRYGSTYERYANCLLLASALPAAVAPTPTGSCVNVPVVQGTIAALSALPAGNPLRANIPVFQALLANPARPGFGSIAAALGQPGFQFAETGVNDSFDQTSNNYAIFTHNVFKLTDRLSITAGLRYTHEEKSLDALLTDNNSFCRALSLSPLAALSQLACVIPSTPTGTFAQTDEKKVEHRFSGTAVVSYKPTEGVLTYASYSKGYKAGGFNLDRNSLARGLGGIAGITTAANLAQLEFKPETVTAFEVGAKLHRRTFDLNVSAFYQRFRNFQLNTFNGVSFVVETVNGCSDDLGNAPRDNSGATGACTGKSEAGVISKGVELEAFLRPARTFRTSVGVTIASTTYADDLVGAGGRALAPAFFQLPGQRISNSPLYTVTASNEWTPDLGGGLRGLVYGDFRYQSELNTGSDLDLEKRQTGVMVVNARIGVSGGEGRWGIELWGQNVFNTRYRQVAFDAPLQGSGTQRQTQYFGTPSTQLFGAFLAEPRTYGVTVRTTF